MGFIYKIVIGNDLYVGSTKQKLYRRQNNHNCSLNNPNRIDYNIPLYKFCRTYNIEKIICELIEEVEDSELRILEQEYINKLQPTLNTNRVYQTIEQRQKQKNLHNKKKSKCPMCGLEMLKKSIKRHIGRIHK